MTTATLDRPITAEDLLAMEDGSHYELVDNQLVERNVSVESSAIAVNVMFELRTFLQRNKTGELYESELGMRLFPDSPNHTRRADVAFMSFERAPDSDSGFLFIAPDLVVEVVSPGDLAGDVVSKAAEWLRAGVRMVWVVYPQDESVHIYERGERPRILQSDETIDGGSVLPGFEAPVASFFATPRRRRAASV